MENNLEGVAAALDAELRKNRSKIKHKLIHCVTLLPLKTPLYATLVGLLNVKNNEFVGEVVNAAKHALETALRERGWSRSRILVRFLCELVNCNVLLASAVVAIFSQFVDVIKGHESRAGSRAQCDFYAGLIVWAMPWIGPELFKRRKDDLSSLMDVLKTYFSEQRTAPDLEAVAVFRTSESPAREELVELWEAVHAWYETTQCQPLTSIISQPYAPFNAQFSNSESNHLLGRLALAPVDDVDRYPGPRRLFTLMPDNELPQDNLVKTLMRLCMHDQINLYHIDRKECAKMMLNTTCPEGLELIIVEGIFSELMRLPNSGRKQVYYTALLCELCKTSQQVPPALLLALNVQFDALESMDIECVQRLVNWFALHLSNFDFRWNWAAWTEHLDRPQSVQYTFIREALAACQRLSYRDRIEKTIPPDFEPLLPPTPVPTPLFTATDVEEGQTEPLYVTVLNKIRSRISAADLLDFLADRDVAGNATRVQHVLQVLMTIGAVSFSHLCTIMDRYKPVLNELCKDEMQALVPPFVARFWSVSPIHITMTIDRLMTLQVVDGACIVHWLLGPDMQRDFDRLYVWEILTTVVDKTIARSAAIRYELRKREQDLESEIHSQHDRANIEEDAGRIRDALDAVLDDQKKLFFAIFQAITGALTNHLGEHNNEETPWFRFTLGQLNSFRRKYAADCVDRKAIKQNVFANVAPAIASGLTSDF